MGLIAIGDIHGCARTLEALIEKLAPTPEDHLVFVGDYVDRGPDVRGVIDRLLALAEQVPCTFLRGNHEAMMLDGLAGKDRHFWAMNGGAQTQNSYRIAGGAVEIPREHIDFLRATKLWFDTPDFFFVHAGLLPDWTVARSMEQGAEDIFLWERGFLHAESLAWEKTVVCGHTPHRIPRNEKQLVLIDTGCVFHEHPGLGRLTAVRLPERTFVSVLYQD